MAIYVFSILSGYPMSGVDTAQSRRGKMLEKSGEKVTYIFTDLPDEYYIQRYRMYGIADKKMLSSHAFLTGKTDLSGKMPASEYIEKYRKAVSNLKVIRDEKQIRLFDGAKRIAVLSLRDDEESVYAVNRYESERLIAQDVYTDRLMWTHHYVTVNDENGAYAKRDRTTFYGEYGSVCYDMFQYDTGKADAYAGVQGFHGTSRERYVFPDGEILDQFAFLNRFVNEMKMTEHDVIIIDRTLGEKWIEPLFGLKPLPRILIYHHSDHYFLPGEDNEHGSVGWNKEYFYYMRNADKIAGFVFASQEQKSDMEKRIPKLGIPVPNIYLAPTCGIEKLEYPMKERRPYSLISVSRLDQRKRVDIVIRAVMKAHEAIPQMNLDIYGTGEKWYVDKLKSIVSEGNAENYIKFMGHQDMKGRYPEYEGFITASSWEVMSVSMMEALAGGNAIIGWDVRYSSRMYVENEKNGLRIPVDLEELADPKYEGVYVKKMADAIENVFSSRARIKSFESGSYEIAKRFLNERLAGIWINIIQDVSH